MVETKISKSAIDRLGTRLRKGNFTEADLRLLDEYRRSFTNAYETVVGAIRQELRLEPTGRPAKSTTSIAQKLRRESVRLTQIQDTAGCRVIIPDVSEQERVLTSLLELFPASTVSDRRQKPSYGYRAVHVITQVNGKPVEIQIRTTLQQLWAELSEKLSDLSDPAIKYGGGHHSLKEMLRLSSEIVAMNEGPESRLVELTRGQQSLLKRMSAVEPTEEIRELMRQLETHISSIREDIATNRQRILKELRELIEDAPQFLE